MAIGQFVVVHFFPTSAHRRVLPFPTALLRISLDAPATVSPFHPVRQGEYTFVPAGVLGDRAGGGEPAAGRPQRHLLVLHDVQRRRPPPGGPPCPVQWCPRLNQGGP